MTVRHDRCKFTDKKLCRPGLKLIGAKTTQRSLLYQFFPDHYTSYVEPFLGTGGVLIGRDPVEVELLGDENWDVANYYHVLKTKPEEFWNELQNELEYLYKNGKDDAVWGRFCFNTWRDRINFEAITYIQRYVLFYLITKHCLNGIWRFNGKGEVNSSYCKTIRGRGIFDRIWFDLVLDRIQNTQFVHADFRKTLGMKNQWDFAFLDPPYRERSIENRKGCKTRYNGKKFTDDDYKDLKQCLETSADKWLLTINDDDWIKDLFKEYEIVNREVFYRCSQTVDGRGHRPEFLIANYPIQDKSKELQYFLEGKVDRKRSTSHNKRVDTV